MSIKNIFKVLLVLSVMSFPCCNSPQNDSYSSTGGLDIAIPSNLAATKGTLSTSINLTWAAVNNAGSYKIYRSSDYTGDPYPFSTWVRLTSTTSTSYSDTSAVTGTLYHYSVTAVVDGNESRGSSYAAGIRGSYALIKIINDSTATYITDFRVKTGTSEPSCDYTTPTPSDYGSNLLSSEIAPGQYSGSSIYDTSIYIPVSVETNHYVDFYLAVSGGSYTYDDNHKIFDTNDVETDISSRYWSAGDIVTIHYLYGNYALYYDYDVDVNTLYN